MEVNNASLQNKTDLVKMKRGSTIQPVQRIVKKRIGSKPQRVNRKFMSTDPKVPSTTERIVDSVPYPETHRLTEVDVFLGDDKPSVNVLLHHFKKEGRIEEPVAKRIITMCAKILREESTMIEVVAPVNICGDVHGQFFDLIRLFSIGGQIPETRYLFLGDYVDRGPFGVEVTLYLFALKINYPNYIFLLRGNHECRHLTESFTFKRECDLKYSLELYNTIMEAFDCLPLAALISEQFLCMHGGISPEIHTLADIKRIQRFHEPPIYGAMCDLLWADPAGNYDTSISEEFFTHNFTRGCSYFFTYEACCDFLKRNRLLSVIRAHEVQANGFRMYKKSAHSGYPSLITVFSAPNYLDLFRNKAAILKYVDNNINIQQFAHSPHPYWLPNFMDVFTWSLPFIAERVAEIFIAILNICSDDELLTDNLYKDEEMKLRHDVIRKKIRAIGKVALVYGETREQAETMVKLQGAAPTKTILKTASPAKAKSYQEAVYNFKSGQNSFENAQNLDNINEERPRQT